MRPLGPDPKHDVAACRAVREAVGPDMHLMLDCHHDYTREEALYIGRELEELDYHWFEEPMNETSTSSYVWLTEHLDIPMVGPESAPGQIHTRAEWIVRNASDISRYDVHHGGITPMMKAIHLCEAFGVRLEVHGGGAAHLHALGAMGIPGEYYERGLLHPFVDYEARHAVAERDRSSTRWMSTAIVPIPQGPGLGHDINWAFIEKNLVR